MLIVCFGNRWSRSDSQFVGQPESRGIHWRMTLVSRGAMPSVVAPGLRRPMTRSQAETGWRSSELAPVIIGSCCSGIQRSGGLLRSVSPKKPGGATPATVNGWPSMTSVWPTSD